MQQLRRFGVGLVIVGAIALVLWGTLQPVMGQANGISGSLRMQIELLNRFAVGLTTVTDDVSKNYTQSWSDGTGANQAKALWHDDRSLTASASENLDFSGSLTDAFGNSLTCTAIKALIVHANSTNTNNVLVGGGSTDITSIFTATNDQLIVRPGGTLMLTAPDATGYAITGGSADTLTITNSAGSTVVYYDIAVLCEE